MNEIPGCPGWYLGVLVTRNDGTVTFEVFKYLRTGKIEGLCASKYRTKEVGELMGDDRPGYEEVAQVAIERWEETHGERSEEES